MSIKSGFCSISISLRGNPTLNQLGKASNRDILSGVGFELWIHRVWDLV